MISWILFLQCVYCLLTKDMSVFSSIYIQMWWWKPYLWPHQTLLCSVSFKCWFESVLAVAGYSRWLTRAVPVLQLSKHPAHMLSLLWVFLFPYFQAKPTWLLFCKLPQMFYVAFEAKISHMVFYSNFSLDQQSEPLKFPGLLSYWICMKYPGL